MTVYRAVAIALAIVFAAVGSVFLLAPNAVFDVFVRAAAVAGRPGMPAADVDAALFRALAVAYMYVVTLLAWMMFRQPAVKTWPTLLAHAKFASAAVSLFLFVAHTQYLVWAANGIVDGAIGLSVLALRRHATLRSATGAGNMNVRLFVLERYVPFWVHRRMLRDLATLTAGAFGVDPPVLARLRRHETVRRFGAFTRGEVDRVLAGQGDVAADAIRRRLHAAAHAMGQQVRRQLAIATRADALRAVRVVYREIGITLDVQDETGEIVVRSCAFSRIYTPGVCAFISALDSGFVCGLTGDAALTFSQRITEGAPTCRAALSATGAGCPGDTLP